MDLLSAYAGELDALALRLGRTTPGSRDIEAVYAEYDDIRRAMTGLSSRMRAGAPAADPAPAGGIPALVITGRNQILCAPARRRGR